MKQSIQPERKTAARVLYLEESISSEESKDEIDYEEDSDETVPVL
jgi:hypothetical protein